MCLASTSAFLHFCISAFPYCRISAFLHFYISTFQASEPSTREVQRVEDAGHVSCVETQATLTFSSNSLHRLQVPHLAISVAQR